MFYKKKDLPEEGEYVLCTVKKILYHSVFVDLDEYENQDGMIHISEISPGRIRNIRDYVREGKKLICKVLRVKLDKKQVDLSLRRVSVSMRKKKNTEIKQEQKAEKIIEIVSKKLGANVPQVYSDFGNRICEEYGSMNNFFQEVVKEETTLKEADIPQKYIDVLEGTIKEKIKPITVEVHANLILQSFAPNGVELIKEALKKITDLAKQKNYNIELSYISAPRYSIKLTSEDYKKAEKAMSELTEAAIKFIESQGGKGEVKR